MCKDVQKFNSGVSLYFWHFLFLACILGLYSKSMLMLVSCCWVHIFSNLIYISLLLLLYSQVAVALIFIILYSTFLRCS
jgi:hypothetical protein